MRPQVTFSLVDAGKEKTLRTDFGKILTASDSQFIQTNKIGKIPCSLKQSHLANPSVGIGLKILFQLRYYANAEIKSINSIYDTNVTGSVTYFLNTI